MATAAGGGAGRNRFQGEGVLSIASRYTEYRRILSTANQEVGGESPQGSAAVMSVGRPADSKSLRKLSGVGPRCGGCSRVQEDP